MKFKFSKRQLQFFITVLIVAIGTTGFAVYWSVYTPQSKDAKSDELKAKVEQAKAEPKVDPKKDKGYLEYLDYLEVLKNMKDSYCMPLVLARNDLIIKFKRGDVAARVAFNAYVDFIENHPTGVNTFMNNNSMYPLWKLYDEVKSAIWLDETARKELTDIEEKKEKQMDRYYYEYYSANLIENQIKKLSLDPLKEYMKNADNAATKKLKLHWLKIAGEYKLEPEVDKKRFRRKRKIKETMLSLILEEGYLDQMGTFSKFLDFVNMYIDKFPKRKKEISILGTCLGAGLTYGKGKNTIYFEVSKKDLKRVRIHLFEKEDSYLSFLADEQHERFTDGEKVIIPWDSLRKKISRYEKFIKNNHKHRTLEVMGTIASMVNAYTCGLEGDRDRCRTDNDIRLSFQKYLEEQRYSQFFDRVEKVYKKLYQ